VRRVIRCLWVTSVWSDWNLQNPKRILLSKHPLMCSILNHGSMEYQCFIDLSCEDYRRFIREHPQWEMHFPLGFYDNYKRLVWVCWEELANLVLKEVSDAYLIVNDLKCPNCGNTDVLYDYLTPKISVRITDNEVIYKVHFTCRHFQEIIQRQQV